LSAVTARIIETGRIYEVVPLERIEKLGRSDTFWTWWKREKLHDDSFEVFIRGRYESIAKLAALILVETRGFGCSSSTSFTG
jgi:hypothetical protein